MCAHSNAGLTRIAETFARTHAAGRAAFMPYWPLGYPDRATSLDIITALAEAGADLLELGVPFSDPLADGPVIQHATQVALTRGTRASDAPTLVADLRARGVQTPIMLMGYLNPVLAYGSARYCADSAAAGVDGLILPDLPPDSADDIETACAAHDLGLAYLLAPTSTDARIALVAQHARGFIYLVALVGVTGQRAVVPSELPALITRIRTAHATIPLAVGFGVQTPAQAAAVGRLADGVIVGTALVALGEQARPVEAVAAAARALRAALDAQS